MKLPLIEIEIKFKGALKSELKKISTSNDIYDVLKLMYDQSTIDWREEMIMICLNHANKVIGYYKVSCGGTTGTVADPKIIFTIALNCAGTTNIIISHNHPSGGLVPSQADDLMTQRIKDGGKLLDIKLLDHLIVTDEGYYSYTDEGKLW